MDTFHHAKPNIYCMGSQFLAVSVQLSAWREWVLLIGWSHSYQRWHWIMLAIVFSVKANRYDREHIKVLWSETAGCHLRVGSTYVWHYHFLWELLLGPLIEEASTGWQRVIYQHSLGWAVQENIQFNFCIGPPYSWASTDSLEPSLLLYCPPTCAIIIFVIIMTN